MPKYEVTATKDVGYKAIIEAPSEEDAWKMAKEGGVSGQNIEWEKSDDGHDWTLENINAHVAALGEKRFPETSKWKVKITQYYVIEGVEAATAEEAKLKATEDHAWDEHHKETILDAEEEDEARVKRELYDPKTGYYFFEDSGHTQHFLKWQELYYNHPYLGED